MRCNTSLLKTALSVFCVGFFVPAVTCEIFYIDLTAKYFSDVSMICDHPDLQISQQADVRSLAWILPDGELIDSSRRPDPRLYQLSGINDRLDSYNLTAMDINDAVFGYYTCIVVYNSQVKPVNVIRWGLNVGGADFTELMQTYQDNAIVGGVAAAAMLVAIGAVCLLWHFRFSNRHVALLDVEEKLNDGAVRELPGQGFHNQSYTSDHEVAEVHLEPEADGNIIRVKM
ncbi:hypothetical protein BsWGS_27090 [Bradybaena similaris]